MTSAIDWTERGRALGASLKGSHAVVVVGEDAVATANVALGIARSQSQDRQVAIADLFGDAPPLKELIGDGDPHGIVDSFLFGVSLNKIAHTVTDAGSLFLLPSGVTPIDPEELFVHPRWRRLAGGFREVGALLLIVASAEAPRLRELADAMDGAIIVGDAVPRDLPVAQSLAWLRSARTSATSLAAAPAPPQPAPLAVVVEAEKARPRRDRKRIVAGAAGIMLSLGLAGAAIWFARRPFVRGGPTRAVSATTPAAPAAAPILAVDSNAVRARADSMAIANATPAINSVVADSFTVLTPANAVDSLNSSAWAVRLEQTNTRSGAILDLRVLFETVPAGTYGYDLQTRFFLLVAGAYQTRAGADSLLVQLRNQKVLAAGNGSVISLPYAFLVQADVPIADVPKRLSGFAARGQPVYALRQANGAAHLYFGAYQNSSQALLAVPTLRAAGIVPTLVYRIGRVF